MTLLAATDNAPTLADTRRITEDDADYQRLHARYTRRLRASIATLVRGLRAGDQGATTAFIHRHFEIMREAYVAAHEEGQRDYWHTVSLKKPPIVAPDPHLVQQRMAWFAVSSVFKMAREATAAAQQSTGRITQSDPPNAQNRIVAPYSPIHTLAGDPDPLAQWQASTDNRTGLQAAIGWSGIQDGYLLGGRNDGANPFALVYWVLEPAAQHCADCPLMAEGSPYNAPGSGGNELDRTPGDGRTECGAGCKCSLAYQPAGALEQQASDAIWSKWFNPDNLQAFATASGIGADLGYHYDPAMVARAAANVAATDPTALPSSISVRAPAADEDLSDEQKAALDSYRDAIDAWDAVRGADLPAAPAFYSETLGELVGDELPDIALMTPAQRIALFRLWDALQQWDDATAPAVDYDIDFDQSFAETDGGDTLLGSPDQPRDAHGRYGSTGWTRESGGGRGIRGIVARIRVALGGGARVTVDGKGIERIEARLGRKASKDQIARLGGAGKGDTVHVTKSGVIEVTHAHDGSRSEVHVFQEEDGKTLRLLNWQHLDAAGNRAISDPRDLARQVRAAREFGIPRITVKTAHEAHDWVAYTRLGYDAKIDSHLAKETRTHEWTPELRAWTGHSLQDMIATHEGAKWWDENGWTPSLHFYTGRGTASVRILDALLAARGEKGIDA